MFILAYLPQFCLCGGDYFEIEILIVNFTNYNPLDRIKLYYKT